MSGSPVDQYPDEDIPPISPCPKCQGVTAPITLLARRTSEKTGVRHYGLVGCQHARMCGEWNFPPYGFSTSRRTLVEAWNNEVKEHI